MKKIILLISLTLNFYCFSQTNVEKEYKGFIEKDSTIWIPQGMNREHRIFGYQNKNTDSKKLILISVFTKDVENNPYSCKYGAYYNTQGMDGLRLKYISTENDFMKMAIINDEVIIDEVYMESKWFEFEKEKEDFEFIATKTFVELKLPDSLILVPNKSLIADFNGDTKPDIATLVKNKHNSKIGVLIVNHSNKEMFVFGAGKKIDNMTDLNWIEIFEIIPKGQIVTPELVDEETGDLLATDEFQNFTLLGNGIYMSATETHGGGIIFWNGKEYQWHHIE